MENTPRWDFWIIVTMAALLGKLWIWFSLHLIKGSHPKTYVKREDCLMSEKRLLENLESKFVENKVCIEIQKSIQSSNKLILLELKNLRSALETANRNQAQMNKILLKDRT